MLKATKQELNVKKRDGRVVSFDPQLITLAIQKAFCAEQSLNEAAELDADLLEQIDQITSEVVETVHAKAASDAGVSVEQVQDTVERQLMKAEHFSVARRYILYRAEQSKIRQLNAEERMESAEPFPQMMVQRAGQMENLDFARLREQLASACVGFEDTCDADSLFVEVEKQFYNGITPKEIARSMVLAARAKIENDPSYDAVAGRLVLNIIYRESLDKSCLLYTSPSPRDKRQSRMPSSA